MAHQKKPTCVVPAIPSSALNNLAGWLLKALVDCRTARRDGTLVTWFYVDEHNYEAAEIDAAFVRYFSAEPDQSGLKTTLIRENGILSTELGLIVGTEINITTLDLNDLFQLVTAHSRGNPATKDIAIVYTAGFVAPEDFTRQCMSITADEIKSLSYEQSLVGRDSIQKLEI